MSLNPLNAFGLRDAYRRMCGENSPAKLADKIKPFIVKSAKQAIEEWKIAREKMKDIPGTNYELALLHMKNGNLDDAILRFKMVIFLTPEKAEAYYNLARCLVMVGDNESAEENLTKALSFKPDFAEAKYVLEKIKAPESISDVPASVITQHIAWRTEFSEEEREAKLHKDKSIVTMALENVTDKNPNLVVLDLGCSEGGRGEILKSKEVARKIVGVDLWQNATDKAKGKTYEGEAIYSSLHNIEISEYLGENREKYDLIMAGDAFSYKGNLEVVFRNIAESLIPGGLFVSIFPKNEEASNYKIDIIKDRFVHSAQYIEETMKKSGLVIAEKKQKNIAEADFDIIVAKIPT